MKTKLGLLLTTILSCFILYSCMSQEQQEQVLQNSEPQAVDVTVNVGGDSRAERFLGTFDQISRLSLDIDRNYGNKRVLTDFPLAVVLHQEVQEYGISQLGITQYLEIKK